MMFIFGLIIGGLIMTAIIPAISVSGRQAAEEDYIEQLKSWEHQYGELWDKYLQLHLDYKQLALEMIKCGMIMQSREENK